MTDSTPKNRVDPGPVLLDPGPGLFETRVFLRFSGSYFPFLRFCRSCFFCSFLSVLGLLARYLLTKLTTPGVGHVMPNVASRQFY